MANDVPIAAEAPPGFLRKWWIYQRERFPVVAHGPLVLAFSLSALCFSSMLRGQWGFPRPAAIVTAFVGSLCFFLELRIADEFKDAREDALYRPYRPVPRGLVTLRELGVVGICAGLVQLALTLWLCPPLVLWLAVTWAYLGLMSKEFFAGEWLRARPMAYLWSHMLIMPLIDVYTSACDWLPAGSRMPIALSWFLAATLFNGVTLEVGRKIRAPESEETGVQTYTALYGPKRAVTMWLAAMAVTFACALTAAARIRIAPGLIAILVVSITLGAIFAVAALVAAGFLRRRTAASARPFELVSGLWTLALYLTLGIVPMLAHRLL